MNKPNEKLQLAEVFKDHMVLQYGKPLRLWGTGPNNEQVTATLQGQTISTTITHNKWEITFSPLHLGKPETLHVSTSKESITCCDLLIGDVYLAGGQSNMAMPIRAVQGGSDTIQLDDFPEIRVCDMVARHYKEGTCYMGGNDEIGWEIKSTDLVWKPAKGDALKNFSAIGYYFSKELHQTQNIPIGIINCSWGGKSASCWLREDYFYTNPKLQDFYEDFLAKLATVDSIEYTKAFTEYALNVQHYIHGETDIWPMEPFGPLCSETPTRLYDSMFSRLIPLTIKGVIWYQGESDEYHHAIYEALFTTLIQNWREDLRDPNLPFFFVQLPSYDTKEASPDPYFWGYLRAAQAQVARKVPHTYMAITLDVGEKDDIHPTDKKTVAHRLALLARKYLYHEDILANSPILKAATYKDKQLNLYFKHIGKGLKATGEDVKGVTIQKSDGTIHTVKAYIKNGQLVIPCECIKEITSVSYGYESYCIGNLTNSEDLPVAPFKITLR